MIRAWIGLGSNRGDRAGHLQQALAAVGAIPGVRVAAVSSIYETAPVGDLQEPPYLNAVIGVDTGLDPRALLDALAAVERALGRPAAARRGPRTIDLDLLLHGEARIVTGELVVPHPRMLERAFVLEPLAEVAPRERHPEVDLEFAELARRAPGRSGVRWVGRFQEVPA